MKSEIFLTPTEVARAVWFDFEGNKDAPPTVLGVMVDGEAEQWILEEAFATFANRKRARAAVGNLRDVSRELLDRCHREDRRLVSWSRHDYNLIRKVLDPEYRGVLGGEYRNAIFTAKRWRELKRREMAGSNDLSTYMGDLAWDHPEGAGEGVVGTTLTLLRSRLDAGTVWTDLTKNQRKKWRNLLKHNRHDLRGMEAVVARCSKEVWNWLGFTLDEPETKA